MNLLIACCRISFLVCFRSLCVATSQLRFKNIWQRCIKLIKSDCKDIYNVQIHASFTSLHHVFYKNVMQIYIIISKF